MRFLIMLVVALLIFILIGPVVEVFIILFIIYILYLLYEYTWYEGFVDFYTAGSVFPDGTRPIDTMVPYSDQGDINSWFLHNNSLYSHTGIDYQEIKTYMYPYYDLNKQGFYTKDCKSQNLFPEYGKDRSYLGWEKPRTINYY